LRRQREGGRQPRGALHAGRLVREEWRQPGGLPDRRAHTRAASPGQPHRGTSAAPLEAARRHAGLKTAWTPGGPGGGVPTAGHPTAALTTVASCEPHDAPPRKISLAVYSWTVTLGLELARCPSCGGRMRLLALVTDPKSVARFMRHLGEPLEPPARAPARDPPFWQSRVLRRRHERHAEQAAQLGLFEEH